MAFSSALEPGELRAGRTAAAGTLLSSGLCTDSSEKSVRPGLCGAGGAVELLLLLAVSSALPLSALGPLQASVYSFVKWAGVSTS